MKNTRQNQFTKILFTFALLFISFINLNAQETAPQAKTATVKTGKAPLIIVPGLTGSELVNRENGRCRLVSAKSRKR